MEIILNLISEYWSKACSNKEFIALLGIFIYEVKQYTAIKVQKTFFDKEFEKHCLKFEKQDIKIQHIKEDSEKAVTKSEEAKSLADKAFVCVKEIDRKVTEIHKNYKKYLEDKHQESLTNQNK